MNTRGHDPYCSVIASVKVSPKRKQKSLTTPYTFIIGEEVVFQYKIKNVCEDKSITILALKDFTSYGLKYLRNTANLEYREPLKKKDGDKDESGLPLRVPHLEINLKLKPGETFTFTVVCEAVATVERFSLNPQLYWLKPIEKTNAIYDEKTKSLRRISSMEPLYIAEIIYSIVPPLEVGLKQEHYQVTLSNVDIKTPLEENINKLLIEFGIDENDLSKFQEGLLPFNFSFTYHRDNKEIRRLSANTIKNVGEKVNLTSGFKVVFVTGPRLSGKTTFGAALLYHHYKMNKHEKNRKIIVIPTKKFLLKKYSREHTIFLKRELVKKLKKIYKEGETLKDLLDISYYAFDLIDIWLDFDFYTSPVSVKALANLLSEISRSSNKQITIYITIDESAYNELLEIYRPNNYFEIKLHEYTGIQFLDLIFNNFKLNKNAQRILTKCINSNIQANDENFNLFSRPSYLASLIDIVNDITTQPAIEMRFSNEIIVLRAIFNTIMASYKPIQVKVSAYRIPGIIPIDELLMLDLAKNKEEAASKPVLFRPGNPYGIDFEAGYVVKRSIEKEIFEIINNSKVKALFINGNSGSGKTTLALRAGYSFWKRGFVVYFIDLSKVNTVQFYKQIKKFQKFARHMIFILDNGHLDIDRSILMALLRLKPYKVIITERTTSSIIKKLKDVYDKAGGVIRLSDEFDLARMAIKDKEVKEVIISDEDFKELTKRLINLLMEKQNLHINKKNIEAIIDKLIEMTNGTIYLLRYILKLHIDHGTSLSLESLSKVSLLEAVNYYLTQLEHELIHRGINRLDAEKIDTILSYLGMFSQYEIYVPLEFIINRLHKTSLFGKQEVLERVVTILIELREIVEVLISKEKYLSLPHVTFAKHVWMYGSSKVLQYTAPVKEYTELFLHTETLLSDTATKLLKYQPNLLSQVSLKLLEDDKLLARFGERVNKLTPAEVTKLFDVLSSDVNGNKLVGRVISYSIKELYQLDFISATLPQLTGILKALKRTSPLSLVEKFIDYQIMYLLKRKDLQGSLIDFTKLVSAVAEVNEEMTKPLIDVLKRPLIHKRIHDENLYDLARFVLTFYLRDPKFTTSVLLQHWAQDIVQLIENSLVKEVVDFIVILDEINYNLAKSFIEKNAKTLANLSVENAPFSQITTLLYELYKLNRKVAVNVVHSLITTSLSKKDLLKDDFLDIIRFLNQCYMISPEEAKLFLRLKDDELYRLLSDKTTNQIVMFSNAISKIDRNFAANITYQIVSSKHLQSQKLTSEFIEGIKDAYKTNKLLAYRLFKDLFPISTESYNSITFSMLKELILFAGKNRTVLEKEFNELLSIFKNKLTNDVSIEEIATFFESLYFENRDLAKYLLDIIYTDSDCKLSILNHVEMSPLRSRFRLANIANRISPTIAKSMFREYLFNSNEEQEKGKTVIDYSGLGIIENERKADEKSLINTTQRISEKVESHYEDKNIRATGKKQGYKKATLHPKASPKIHTTPPHTLSNEDIQNVKTQLSQKSSKKRRETTQEPIVISDILEIDNKNNFHILDDKKLKYALRTQPRSAVGYILHLVCLNKISTDRKRFIDTFSKIVFDRNDILVDCKYSAIFISLIGIIDPEKAKKIFSRKYKKMLKIKTRVTIDELATFLLITAFFDYDLGLLALNKFLPYIKKEIIRGNPCILWSFVSRLVVINEYNPLRVIFMARPLGEKIYEIYSTDNHKILVDALIKRMKTEILKWAKNATKKDLNCINMLMQYSKDESLKRLLKTLTKH